MAEIYITEAGADKVEAFLRECAAKRKELLDAGKDTAEQITALPVYADVVEAIEPTEDGVWSETFSVTDNEDLTIRLDEGEDFYVTAL